MSNPWPKGLVTALVTPLRDDAVDRDAFRRLIDYQIENGAAGLVITGGTGEYNFLTLGERERLFADAVEFAAGRVPVIAASGCLATRDTIKLSLSAEAAGVAGLLVTSAFGEPIGWHERRNFYAELDAAVETPIMIYNTPPAGLLNFEQVRELAELTNVSALKDSSGDPTLMGDMLAWSRGSDFAVYVGLDSFMFEAVLTGARGAVFGTANFLPAELSQVIALVQNGEIAEAQARWRDIRPVLRFMEQVTNYVALCKVGLGLRGIDVGPVRKPNLMPDRAEIEDLARILATLN